MNIEHHLSDGILLDYSSGALTEAWSIAVASHLSVCPACRDALRDAEEIGGSFLESAGCLDVSQETLGAILERLDASGGDEMVPGSVSQDEYPTGVLPSVLRHYVAGDLYSLPWKRAGGGIEQVVLQTTDKTATARLLRIPAGRKVPHHRHSGREITCIFSGGFTDVTGEYGPGDIQEVVGDVEHQPWVRDSEDCICLTVTEAPLRFTGIAARLAQPFVGI